MRELELEKLGAVSGGLCLDVHNCGNDPFGGFPSMRQNHMFGEPDDGGSDGPTGPPAPGNSDQSSEQIREMLRETWQERYSDNNPISTSVTTTSDQNNEITGARATVGWDTNSDGRSNWSGSVEHNEKDGNTTFKLTKTIRF